MAQTNARDASPNNVTKQELQDRWKHLELKTSTLLHLQEVLDRRGITAAVTVTDVLVREKRPNMGDMGKEWSFEELRLLSLEGIRPHLMDLIRVTLESLMAWHFIHVPESALDGMVEMVLALLFLVVGVGAICFACHYRDKKQTSGSRSKPRSMLALLGDSFPHKKRQQSPPSHASFH